MKMLMPPVFELGNVSVADPGIPGQERIIFRPTEQVNLVQCGLLIGWRNSEGVTTPLDNEFFWFGELVVTPPCWVVVYTGKGEDKLGNHNGSAVYFRYWGKDATVFNYSEVIPLVIKFAGVQFGGHLKQLPSFEKQQSQLNSPPVR